MSQILPYIKKIKLFAVKPEGFFLIFSVLFGLVFVFMTPPLEEPDAHTHFLRAYQVSNLQLVTSRYEKDGKVHFGSEIPKSINVALIGLTHGIPGSPTQKFHKYLFDEYIKQPLNPKDTEMTIVESAGVYSPIVYIPQALGIAIGRIFNASPLILIWLARLMNLILWISVIYVALKLLPFAKWALAILALSPIAVFFSASVSPDVINISFSFLFFSIIASTLAPNQTMTKKKLFALLFVLSVLSLSKPVNILFAFLLPLVPMRHFNTKFRYVVFCVGGFLLSFILFYLWNHQIKEILDLSVNFQSGGQHVSVKEQFLYVLSEPVTYLKDIIKNYIIITSGTYGDAVLITYFGVLGWLDTSIPLWIIFLYMLSLFFSLLYQFGRGITFTLKQKLFLIGFFIIAFVGNITAMYFNATSVGNHVISGVQGRYFIPFSVVLLGLFTYRKKLLQISNEYMFYILAISMTIVLSMTVLKVFLRYYI